MARINFSPARSITAMTSAMRNVFPDFEMMYVVEVAGETSLFCKKPHWPVSVRLPLRAGLTTKFIQPGQWVVVRFEDGRRFVDGKSRLFMLSGDAAELEPVPLTFNWCYWRADALRTNSWTTSAFDVSTAANRSGFSGAKLHFRVEELEPDGGPGFYPTRSIGTSTAVTTQDFSSFDSVDITTLLDDASITYDFAGLGSLCRVGGYLYAELLAYIEDGDDILESRYVAKLNAAYTTGFTLDLEWLELLYEGTLDDPGRARIDGTDLIVVSLNTGSEEEPVLVDRVVGISQSPEYGEIYITHISADDGLDLVEVFIEGAEDYLDSGVILQNRLATTRPRLWASGDKIWISASAAIHCVQIDVAGAALLWSSDDWAFSYAIKVWPLGLLNETMLCAFEGEVVGDTVTDAYLDDAAATFGAPAPEERTIVAAGVSYKGGTMTLVASTGVEISRRYFSETPVDTDTSEGARTDHLVTLADVSYTAPTRSLDAEDDLTPADYIFTGFGELRFPRFYSWFWHEGFEYDPMTDNPVDETSLGYDIPSGDRPTDATATGATWHSNQDARVADHLALMAERFDEVAAARPVLTGGTASGIVADYYQLEITCVTAGEPRTSLGDLTWTDVRGPLAPPSLVYEDQYMIRAYENTGYPRLPDGVEDPGASPASDFWDDFHVDPEPFEGVTSEESAFGPVGGATMRVTQKVIFREAGEVLQRQRSGTPGWGIGNQCVTSNSLVVSGPISHSDGGVYNPLKWEAIDGNNEVAWTYEHPSTGGATFCDAGCPVAVVLSDETAAVVTFVVVDTTYTVIILNAEDGTLIDEITSPTSMLEAIFDETHFYNDIGGGKWGPA